MRVVEILTVVAAVGSLVVYHVYLWRRIRSDPAGTAMGHANRSRRRWVKSVIDERRDILAVQTLRNWSMAASFLASTAVLLTIGLLSVLLSFDEVPGMLQQLNFVGSVDSTTFTVKSLLLVLCFLAAFFNFSVSLRYFNHVALDICVPMAPEDGRTGQIIMSLFDRGAAHYTLGMRCYYVAVPVTLWFFGPTWMLAGTIALLIVLYWLDHLPASGE